MSVADTTCVFVQSFGFNQDGSCFWAATTQGFRVYTCSPLSEFARREGPSWSLSGNDGVRAAAMLYRSSCFALVTVADSRRMHLWDDKKATVVTAIRCRQPVLNVLLGRDVICVVAEAAVRRCCLCVWYRVLLQSISYCNGPQSTGIVCTLRRIAALVFNVSNHDTRRYSRPNCCIAAHKCRVVDFCPSLSCRVLGSVVLWSDCGDSRSAWHPRALVPYIGWYKAVRAAPGFNTPCCPLHHIPRRWTFRCCQLELPYNPYFQSWRKCQ